MNIVMAKVTPEVPEVLKELPQIDESKAWRMYVDGAKNNLGEGIGAVLKTPKGAIFECYLKLNFPMTNNEAEYEAFIAELGSTNKLLVLVLHIFSDSKMVVNQVTRNLELKEQR